MPNLAQSRDVIAWRNRPATIRVRKLLFLGGILSGSRNGAMQQWKPLSQDELLNRLRSVPLCTKIPDVMRALTTATAGRRKIHVDLPEEIHRKLRVKAALEDVSMQAYIARVVEKAVKDAPLPEGGNHRSGKGGA